jgi:hypothetical protein
MDLLLESHLSRLESEWNKWSWLVLLILIPLIGICFYIGPLGGLLRVMITAPFTSEKYETMLVEFLEDIHSGNQLVLVHKPQDRPFVYRVEYSLNTTMFFQERDYDDVLAIIKHSTPEYEIVFRDGIIGPDYLYVVEFSNGIRAKFEFGDLGSESVILESLEVDLPDP